MAEILEWSAASNQRQLQIVAAARQRREQRQQPWVSR
tara:strand:- start:460 stop:570 length:111 start_codon:yes stop_codon:yes gene_type:complete